MAAKLLLHRCQQSKSEEVKQEAVEDAAKIIEEGIQQVRSMSHLLHPPLLDEVGLLSALRWYLEGFTQRSGIETSIEVDPPDYPRLSPDLETAIFRIVQESLSNVFRHAQAQNAQVALSLEDGNVVTRIRDDGRGVTESVSEQQPGSIGIGIGGMSQRVKEFGGELRILHGSPGTVVEILIPHPSPRAATQGVT